KQKWYEDPRTTSDHNAKYLSKLQEMKEQLQKEGQFVGSQVGGKTEHTRHRTHPLPRPGLTRHLSLNLPVFVTNPDFSSVPRAGRLSMYKSNKHVPAIHPVQGVGLLEDSRTDHHPRKIFKRNENVPHRQTSLDKGLFDLNKGSQPPGLKRFPRSQKATQLSSRVQRSDMDPKEESCMHLKSYNVACSHGHGLGRLRSRSTCSENEALMSALSHTRSLGRIHPDTQGVLCKGRSSSKYRFDHSNSSDHPHGVGLELAPVKRSIKVEVPFDKGEGDLGDVDSESSGYKAPIGTPHTVSSQRSDVPCAYCNSDSGMSIGKASSSTGSSNKDTSDTDEWSDIGVTLSQIRLSHSQSEPSIKDFTRIMANEDVPDVEYDVDDDNGNHAQPTSSRSSEDAIPVLQINSRSEEENESQMENKLTINTPFIMFRPATPRMPEPEEKSYDNEVGRVLVKAATQAELRRKEMRRLLEDIEEFNSANKNLYNKVHPVSS
ncbi:uncharacterized protein, partial [Diadema antillarum]|uniref:uncharacterized protein n=1 Tax=Diadema antillarum TaxID=105358 RepID=UPI003A83ACF8